MASQIADASAIKTAKCKTWSILSNNEAKSWLCFLTKNPTQNHPVFFHPLSCRPSAKRNTSLQARCLSFSGRVLLRDVLGLRRHDLAQVRASRLRKPHRRLIPTRQGFRAPCRGSMRGRASCELLHTEKAQRNDVSSPTAVRSLAIGRSAWCVLLDQ